MIIGLEKEQNFPEIYTFTKEAFKTAKVKDGDEQNFIDRLRKSDNYLPELAFTAEENSEIIGHIMLTKTTIKGEDKTHEELILAPLTVRLDQRNKGLGGKLIAYAEQEAKNKGYQAIILIGDPEYYTRYGFVQASKFGIVPDQEIPLEYVLVKKINQAELADLAGTAVIPV